jgi:UDP-N-acetylglucosamine--N-acetylmuramyl-(pentapeptide) pyrophosphoryl-undecaprenol N-acetylglucosamine transferase
MPELLPKIPLPLEIRHQAGRDNSPAVRESYAGAGAGAEVADFIEDMASAYAWADLVICRAGAMTVAEICASGSAAVFVPFPAAVEDHQTANARWMYDREAAWIWPEEALSLRTLSEFFSALSREQIGERAAKARGLAVPDSTRRVGDECMQVLYA